MPDLSKNIEDFCGEIGSIAAKEWLDSIENMKLRHRWPDSFVPEETRMHMKRIRGSREEKSQTMSNHRLNRQLIK